MEVITSEMIAMIDVDGTLIKWGGKSDQVIKVQFGNEDVRVVPFHQVIRYVKHLHSRGFFIYVWSGNGFQHAKNVIEELGLEEYVGMVSSKPLIMLDDKEPMSWIKWINVDNVKA